jgi:hypothetical protein
MNQFIYAGPSWAVSSYPDHVVPATSLLKEWKLPAISVAQCMNSNFDQIKLIRETNSDLPVVFLYCEPILDLEKITGLSLREFVESENWQEIWHICNKQCLEEIQKLPNPVALIGAHSDIVSENTTNVVLHNSWQKWIGSQCGMDVTNNTINVDPLDGGNYKLLHCWGAEILHLFLHQNPNVKPYPTLLDSIWDVYFFWEELERRNWFYQVHPNYIANVEFAKYTKLDVTNFLNNI